MGSAGDLVAYRKFGIGGKPILCVASSDMDSMLIPYNDESVDLSVGLGHTPGFGFLFEPEEVRKYTGAGTFQEFSKFQDHPYVNKLSGSIGFLSVTDSRRLGPAMHARSLADEWRQSGSCAQEVVIQLPQSDLYEVKCRAEDNFSNVLDRSPEKNRPMPDPNSVVVATCLYETISTGKFAGQSLRTCTRVAILDGFILNYRIQEDNLPLYKRLDTLLQDKIRRWKENCNSQ